GARCDLDRERIDHDRAAKFRARRKRNAVTNQRRDVQRKQWGKLRRAGYPENGFTRHGEDRKSTRLNSSHRTISYAVFCWKKQTPPRPRADALHLTFARLPPDSLQLPPLESLFLPPAFFFRRLEVLTGLTGRCGRPLAPRS